MDILLQILNSPAVITLIASGVLYLLNKVYAKKPAWKEFEGHIVSFIQLAEKGIPDTTSSEPLQKADYVLKKTLEVFEAVKNRRATEEEIHELKDGINLSHSALKAEGIV